MYTVSKGPSKIVAKTRRGLSQNLERLDSRKDYNRKSSESDNGEIISMPKPVFHSNGKKTVHQRIQHQVITPEHEEIIRYISETWTQTANGDSEPSTPTSTIATEIESREVDPSDNAADSALQDLMYLQSRAENVYHFKVHNCMRTFMSEGSGSSSPAPPSNLYYQDDAPSAVLHDFKPFDLETWWGKRLFQNITSSL